MSDKQKMLLVGFIAGFVAYKVYVNMQGKM